jgi:hypothetical protein
VPHAEASTRDDEGRRTCPYCGVPLAPGRAVCSAHADLPALEPLDDRYLIAGGK